MPAFFRVVLLLLPLLFIAPAHAAGLPGLLGGGSKAQPEATEPLGQSLDEVIKTLENDQQRSKLLADLKKLRDSTKQAQPSAEQGVLGLIGSTFNELEKQFSGEASPFNRWTRELELAQIELDARLVPGTNGRRSSSALPRSLPCGACWPTP